MDEKAKGIGEKKMGKGLRLYNFSVAMAIGMLVLCICLLYTTVEVSQNYDGVMQTTEEYVHWSENALKVHEASEYLTEQVRLFAQTGERAYMENYFLETYITQRRTKVLQEIEDYYDDSDTELLQELERAIYESQRLTEREYYAMKLICIGMGLSTQYIPPEIREAAFKMGDTSLSPEEQRQKGKDLLYDTEYQKAKKSIYAHLNTFVAQILEETGEKRENGILNFLGAINMQRMFIGTLVLLGVIMLLVVRKMITEPLLRFIKRIRERAMLDIVGVEELQVLAREYNELYAALAAEATDFQYRPENDPLTCVMHQDTYREIAEALQENDEPMALVIFRMDHFAALVEKYDDYTIDWMIRKAAALLAEQAELKDHVFRTDRAEFAAIFMDVDRKKQTDVEVLFQKINADALHPDDSLPAFSLSAGAAFSERGWQKALSGKAREALLQAHKRGEVEICFYEE